MAFTIQLNGVIKLGSGSNSRLLKSISPKVTTIEEWLEIREKLTGTQTKVLDKGGLTGISFCYLEFKDASTLDPTHAKVVMLTAGGAPVIADSVHTTEFLYINSTGTVATDVSIISVAACFVEGWIAGAA